MLLIIFNKFGCLPVRITQTGGSAALVLYLKEETRMHYISVILNMFIIVLLVRLISAPDRETFFNPFVSFTNSRLNRLIEFLKPALALPEKATLGIILIFVFFFKTLLLSKLKFAVSVDFGEVFRVLPPEQMPENVALLLFSLLNTISFIFKFWSFYLIISFIGATGKVTRASQALQFYAKPFSKSPLRIQLIVLVICHIALAFIALQIGTLVAVPIAGSSTQPMANPIATSPLIIGLIKTTWIGMLSIFEGISIIISVLFAFIIGSLITALMHKPNIAMLCREGIDLTLGRFSQGRPTKAGLDFTPLIFFFVASISYNILNSVIYTLVNSEIPLPF